MPITSLQVCMDSTDWLQGSIAEDQIAMTMDNSSPITPQSGEIGMLTCSRPMMMEPRRLRPQHEQPLKCPRCESTHTKFCYYNNYSLTQPRYFCKSCRRYWTKGGTLRNVPVGGGCRKTKKQSSKTNPSKSESSSTPSPLILHPNDATGLASPALSRHDNNSPDLQLAFSEQMQFLSLHGANPGFLLENQAPIGLMENKYEALLGGNYNFMGNNHNNGENFGGLMGLHGDGFNGILPSFGMMMPNSDYHGSGNSNVLESSERHVVPFENLSYQHLGRPINHDELQDDVKPNAKIMAIEWQDQQQQQQQQACNSGRESFGYNFGGLGSWTGLMNGYGSSATNPLV